MAAAVVCGSYVADAAWRGALGIPRNDDWVYYASARAMAREGRFVADGWTSTMLVGHDLLAQPVIAIAGFDITPLQLLVATLAVVGLWATYAVVREVLPARWAWFPVSVLALGPVYGSLAVSFMTDVPAFALQAVALWCAARALRDDRLALPWLLGSFIAGLAALTFREYAIAATLAVLITVAVRWRRRRRPTAVGALVLGGVFVLVSAALLAWRRSLSTPTPVPGPSNPVASGVTVTGVVLLTAGMLCLPTLALGLAPSTWRRARARPALALATVVVTIGIAVVARRAGWVLGNYFTTYPSYAGATAGEAPHLWVGSVWKGLLGLAVLLVGLLCFLTADSLLGQGGRARPAEPATAAANDSRDGGDGGDVRVLPGAKAAETLLAAYVLLVLAEVLAVRVLTGPWPFDRYLVPIVPFVAALAVRTALTSGDAGRRLTLAVGLATALWCAVGVHQVDATATTDGLRWHAATDAERSGLAAATIEGGYEWFASHQPKPVTVNFSAHAVPFWVALFPGSTVCARLVFGAPGPPLAEQAGSTVLTTRSARTLTGARLRVTVYRMAACEAAS